MKFYTFITESGHQISLTSLHLIPIVNVHGELNYIPAKDIQIGDQFTVRINEQLQTSPVINITIEIKQGYFAPLTLTGNIFIILSAFLLIDIHLRNNFGQ